MSRVRYFDAARASRDELVGTITKFRRTLSHNCTQSEIATRLSMQDGSWTSTCMVWQILKSRKPVHNHTEALHVPHTIILKEGSFYKRFWTDKVPPQDVDLGILF